jgi:hypothetical protein
MCNENSAVSVTDGLLVPRAPHSVILCKTSPQDDSTHLCLRRGGYIKKRKSSIVTSTFIGSCGSPGCAALDNIG